MAPIKKSYYLSKWEYIYRTHIAWSVKSASMKNLSRPHNYVTSVTSIVSQYVVEDRREYD